MAERINESWTSGTGVMVTFNYQQEFENLTTAINNLRTAVEQLTDAMGDEMFGAAASNTVGSVANSGFRIVGALRASAGMDIDGNKKQGEGLAAMSVIAQQLSGIASSINTGVAIQTLTSMDQMQKNAFDKEATQQALERNKIPKVVVTEANFAAQVQSNVTAGANLYAQASTVGLVNATASRAITGAANYAYDLLPSYATISNNFKTLFKSKQADPEGEAARNEASIQKNI